MARYSTLSTVSALLLVVGLHMPVFGNDDQVALSEELTTLYRSARAVISKHQQHINNPDIGDKGLTPAVVASQALDNYRRISGKPLDMSTNTEAKQAMMSAIKGVMADNQDLINEKGVGLKGLLPAIYARQVATYFNESMLGRMKIKLTAPNKYIRNRANRPDKWEDHIIDSKFLAAGYAKGKPFFQDQAYEGKDAFRFILPEYYVESCLSCHGKPRGELDITGGKKEGGVLGELGGAISLTIFK